MERRIRVIIPESITNIVNTAPMKYYKLKYGRLPTTIRNNEDNKKCECGARAGQGTCRNGNDTVTYAHTQEWNRRVRVCDLTERNRVSLACFRPIIHSNNDNH